jgi:ZIP family zinc transporter
MPTWLHAGLWGLVAGSALVLGSLVGYSVRLPRAVIAGVMAFGSGVLISALSFELMEDAYREAGVWPMTIGFFAGALIYSLANGFLSRHGGKHRKRSSRPPQPDSAEGGGTAIAVGSLLDGIPESIAIGLTMITSGAVSASTLIAIFLSNIPEGLSSSAGMKDAGRPASFIFGIWIVIALVCGLAALAGFQIFANVSPGVRAATTAFAAGAILSMLAETMVPEAFEGTRDWAGLITCAGFICAFVVSALWG